MSTAMVNRHKSTFSSMPGCLIAEQMQTSPTAILKELLTMDHNQENVQASGTKLQHIDIFT
jgi:hypothetical protein